MEIIESIVERRLHPDVYVLEKRIPVEEIAQLAQANNIHFFHLRGNRIHTDSDLFREAMKVMRFPDYFGKNWNALLDCMRDLSFWWPSSNGNLVLYDDFENLAKTKPEGFRIAVEVFQGVVESWRGTDTPMYVLLIGDKSLLPNIKALEA